MAWLGACQRAFRTHLFEHSYEVQVQQRPSIFLCTVDLSIYCVSPQKQAFMKTAALYYCKARRRRSLLSVRRTQRVTWNAPSNVSWLLGRLMGNVVARFNWTSARGTQPTGA